MWIILGGCGWVGHYFGWVGIRGGAWGIILGEWDWVAKCFRWVGVDEGECEHVRCLIMPP